MAQVKRQDSLGTLSDQTTFARLENARVTVGGRQYKIDSLDSSAYSGLVNGTIYQVYVTAPSATPELVITTLTPGTAYAQVGEMYVGAGGAKTLITDSFSESSKRRTIWVDNSVLDIVTASSGLNNPPSSLPAGASGVRAQVSRDNNGAYWLEFVADYNIASAQNNTRFTFTGVEVDATSSFRVAIYGWANGSKAAETMGTENGTPNRLFADSEISANNWKIVGKVPLTGKPTWYDENLDV